MNRPAIGLLLLLAATTSAQFQSGSNGSDGLLAIPRGDGSPRVVDFDPGSFNPPLDPDGDGVYHFTGITIPDNVRLRLRADKCGFQPQYWLSSGPVIISGHLDLDGEAPVEVPYGVMGVPTIPGPGGFPGGIGEVNPDSPAQPGLGPGGGSFPRAAGNHATFGFINFGTQLYGSPFLVPLVGGSGGAGSPRDNSIDARSDTVLSGGAGGGAILIASDVSISVSGEISARGGDKPDGRAVAGFPQVNLSGGGSGGAIRLVAPLFSGGGKIATRRDEFASSWQPGGDGRVRIETAQDDFAGVVLGAVRRVHLIPTTPLGLPGSSPTPTLRVVRIGGVDVPDAPSGLFTAPDLELDSNTPVAFEIEATQIPVGTIVTLVLHNESTWVQTLTSDPLVGTLEASTTTISTTVPAGFSRGHAFANWSTP